MTDWPKVCSFTLFSPTPISYNRQEYVFLGIYGIEVDLKKLESHGLPDSENHMTV